ncbi:hypothetical protein FXO38_14443 [Capsicum annuum]|nr:hypothetical protein FXO38_14443 [Capsicum annuum]KAF3661290.1 hypothetical protein FXO37_12994 [Capsicum annuum]
MILGLKLALKMKLTHITIATDSNKLATTLNDKTTTASNNDESNLLFICRDLLTRLGNPAVIHETRSINGVANLLANEGINLGPACFWKEWLVPPLFVQSQYRADKAGTSIVGKYTPTSTNICTSIRPILSPASKRPLICTNDYSSV